MQEVELYYRRYNRYSCTRYRRYMRYSCTTANAANEAVPNFGTGMTIFICISPIDVSCKNGSRCMSRALLQEVQEVQVIQLYYS